MLGRDGTIAEFVTTGISQEQRAAIGRLPVGRGILGVLIHDARPLRLHELAADPRSVGFPPHHPPMRSFLGVPVMARGRVYGNLYLTDKGGGDDFDAEDERALVLLAAQAGVAIENAQLYEDVQDRARRLEAVREVTTAILAGTDTEGLLGLVVGHARGLATRLAGTVFPAQGSVTGEVMRTGEVVVLADASADNRAAQPIVGAGVGPAVFVPLLARGRTFGSLTVASRPGGRLLREGEVQLVETFAEQAAVALEYARLRGDRHLAQVDPQGRRPGRPGRRGGPAGPRGPGQREPPRPGPPLPGIALPGRGGHRPGGRRRRPRLRPTTPGPGQGTTLHITIPN